MTVRRRQRRGLLLFVLTALAIALVEVAFSSITTGRSAAAADAREDICIIFCPGPTTSSPPTSSRPSTQPPTSNTSKPPPPPPPPAAPSTETAAPPTSDAVESSESTTPPPSTEAAPTSAVVIPPTTGTPSTSAASSSSAAGAAVPFEGGSSNQAQLVTSSRSTEGDTWITLLGVAAIVISLVLVTSWQLRAGRAASAYALADGGRPSHRAGGRRRPPRY